MLSFRFFDSSRLIDEYRTRAFVDVSCRDYARYPSHGFRDYLLNWSDRRRSIRARGFDRNVEKRREEKNRKEKARMFAYGAVSFAFRAARTKGRASGERKVRD